MVASVPGAIAAAVLVPLLIITICLVLFYLWKQKKDKKDIGTGPEVSYIFLSVHGTLVLLWNCILVCVCISKHLCLIVCLPFFHIGRTAKRQVCLYFSSTSNIYRCVYVYIYIFPFCLWEIC